MSALIDVAIQCDKCLAESPERRDRAWALRVVLNRLGWHRYNGVDICPDCWQAGARGPATYRPRVYHSARRPA